METGAKTLDYKVVEDNGGGLALYVFDKDGQVIFGSSGYEYSPGHLTEDLDALDQGDDTSTWESNMDDPQEAWEDYDRWEYGWKIVAEGERGERTLYPDRMGRAAQIEFKIEDE